MIPHLKTLTAMSVAWLVATSLNLAAAPSWNAPASAASQANPVGGNPAAIARGREIFQTACAVCHGATGRGDGAAGAALTPPPADLRSTIPSQSDGALRWKIANGRTPMPGFSQAYGQDDIWKVVSYIRTLAPGGASGAVAGGGQEAARPTTVAAEGDLTDSTGGVLPSLSPLAGGAGEADAFGGFGDLIPGRNSFLFSGYASASFNSIEGADSTFGAKFAPIFLWKQGDNILFEGEIEFDLEDGVTETNLEYAQLAWIVNDYLTIGAGKFLNPMNYYAERVHPDWINKLPDAPLAFGHDGGIIAGTQLGVQARGGIPLGNARLGYAVYVSNGPSIVIEEEEDEDHDDGEEAGEAGGDEHQAANGSLDFTNFSDRNDNLAVGGRVGLQPFPGFEIGYGFEIAEVDPSGSTYDGIDAVTQAVDLNYVRNSEALKGIIEARAQYVWVSIDNPGMAPLDFENRSSGGYVQLAYRPIGVENEVLRNLEAVGRYDWLDLSGGQPDQERFTIGLNYWINQSTVFKTGFEFGERGGDNYTGFRAQAAIGF